ncbi:DNA starvation/stationary phase protection protein [Halolactibacillus alkaliphilus]|uniref:DNA starvation/stationary phase protection protein n=1 Tax=Halolactibacillus alkaliphilus TaxID=442899 RepID=A0A511X3V6_9BACI|nr:DNA starvation/stationary phase protection protein [Halolactibacillus alkaliphilus]GEN57613.1 DNA starvation/stationary phase protection protein [Halolactibacillus alkaliphilus]GGN74388.1 DNA starvation/stationary phase protection protein [Halolactibacillus alkaliphilus]SFP01323.1 starvation-inducible DNA-binding protein [Halolactibacillus alkaliphilus]
MTQLHNQVNKIVATQGVLFTKLHQHHWYVKGNKFFVLHEKFEELYDEVNVQFDEFAERLLTIGGKPYSTLKEFIEHSSIQETPYTKEVSSEDMVKTVLADFEIVVNDLEKGIELAGDANDDVTEDLCIGYKTSLEKHMWMLRYYLD